MAPSTTTTTITEAPPIVNPMDERYCDIDYQYREKDAARKNRPKRVYIWRNIIILGSLHLVALPGLYYFLVMCTWKTVLFSMMMYLASGLGITMGAHRLWSHRSYKAKTPLRILLMLGSCTAAQNDIIDWSRDHRGHHKWTETEADPHNADRGFFFTHVGWLLVRKQPEVIAKGKTIVLDDIANDPVCQWQRRWYTPLAIFMTFIMPTLVPHLLWGEPLFTAYMVAIFRYIFFLNAEWCVNSVAHTFGNRPYDKDILPTESIFTAVLTVGEGWHNFHHCFPYDYRSAELPYVFNLTMQLIELSAWLGQAYDLKTASPTVIKAKMARSGDHSIKSQ